MAIDANILLQGRTPDVVNSLLSGYQAGNAIQQQPVVNQMFQEKMKLLQGQNQAQQMELTQEQAKFQLADMAQDAMMIKPMIESGNPMRTNVALAERIKKIQDRGGDPSDTIALRERLNSGDVKGVLGELDTVINAATQFGVLQPNTTAGMREWQQMTQGFTPDELAQAQRVQAGIAPRQVMAAPRTADIGGVTYVVDPQTSSATLPTVLNQPVPGSTGSGPIPAPVPTVLDPSAVASNVSTITTAEETAKGAVKTKIDAADLARQNQKAFAAYTAGINTLAKSLGATTTIPGMSLIPALTADAQAAEGAIAAMAPILKDVFRQAGEGTFTKDDQAVLLKMLPGRGTLPAARDAQLRAVDSIVRAKMGMPQLDEIQSNPDTFEVDGVQVKRVR